MVCSHSVFRVRKSIWAFVIGACYDKSLYETHIVSHIWSFSLTHDLWPWITFKGQIKVNWDFNGLSLLNGDFEQCCKWLHLLQSLNFVNIYQFFKVRWASGPLVLLLVLGSGERYFLWPVILTVKWNASKVSRPLCLVYDISHRQTLIACTCLHYYIIHKIRLGYKTVDRLCGWNILGLLVQVIMRLLFTSRVSGDWPL